MSDDFGKFTAPKASEEIHQGAEVPVTFSIDPSDRLPVPVMPDNHDTPPPLAVDTLVCMEDKRSFVIRNSDGSIFAKFGADVAKRMPNGTYFVESEEYQAVTGLDPSSWERLRTNERLVVPVEPIRPACQYYVRIQMDVSADRSRRYLSRSCAAQRSETGEYYSVGDSAIYACSLRAPRHLESEQILDDFDALSMQQSLERARAGSFNVDEELAREAEAGGLGVLGQ